MKSFISFFVFSQITFFCFAQKEVVFPIDSITHKVTYSKIVDIENKNKTLLYSDAQKWIVTFNTSNNLKILQSYEEDGQIITQGTVKVKCYTSFTGSCEGCRDYDLVYILTITVKDNKFKYEVTNLMLQYYKTLNHKVTIAKNFEEFYPAQGRVCKESWKSAFNDISENINRAITSLTAALKQKQEKW